MIGFKQVLALHSRRTSLIRMTTKRSLASFQNILAPTDTFEHRHIGPNGKDQLKMLKKVGYNSLNDLSNDAVPEVIRYTQDMVLPAPRSETEALNEIRAMADKNKVYKSFIGVGYYETETPKIILRNMLENPSWYTAYTPYQAEISQGRLEMLLNFQTMCADLTGMDMCNASLLDESTAAAEAMAMSYGLGNGKRNKFFVSHDCHPQNIALIQTRGGANGMEIVVGDPMEIDLENGQFCGMLLQYPNTFGTVEDYSDLCKRAKANKTLVIAAADIMSLTMLRPPGEFGVDVVVGSTQRFGVPMGYGGPHAAFMATKQAYSRKMAGRIIGVSKDVKGAPALRMAMQTREQHIRRDKATSNICTAQALLANMAASYGIYHGPEGLKRIAHRIHGLTCITATALTRAGYDIDDNAIFFDTLKVNVSSMGKTASEIESAAHAQQLNVRVIDDSHIGISFGETHTEGDIIGLLKAFGVNDVNLPHLAREVHPKITSEFARMSTFMEHPIFNSHHSETQMLRYLKKLENKDLALNTSMISLGSCTMKLNATVEMIPVTWPEFANIHPFAPADQTLGYQEMIDTLHSALAEITGFVAMSSQPNSGAQGEYSGLLCIKEYHKANNDDHRDICLIPVSAHGTNPASAVMAGMKVVVVKSDDEGNIDFEDLQAKATKHKDKLAALMITYPSTYGVFEERVKDITQCVHDNGGLVYMDGANMNAQVGLTSPGFIGADVCHLNLHKTFCIPHGGGGPGVGTIGVNAKLAPYLPGHPILPTGGEGDGVVAKSNGTVSAAPFGSAAILPISWMYIRMLGEPGLKKATQMAILNANYMANTLQDYYDILYRGKTGLCAHEFIIDLRPFKKVGVTEEDVAKRLQDYGFHSPTMSWPVSGTLMVEPTESEDMAELDRFCISMIQIRKEIDDVATGKIDIANSPLRNAPHTLRDLVDTKWDRQYSQITGAFPAPWVKSNKFWPTVGRIDNVYGDRNLICSCPPMDTYLDEEELKEIAN